uniref:Lipase n=1 Tax=Plectus sambesii TaxID=2011161 RepID=A0A914UT30_9BILA
MRAICVAVLFLCGIASGVAEDPEVTADFSGIVQHWGYPVEEHDVTTADGYILTVHRIPYGKNGPSKGANRPVVFLMHGLEGSSASWVLNLPNESAGFMFADAGFDCWFGNFRGNVYSKRHVQLDPNSHDFWKFSWDQMASKDLPAMIQKVLDITGQDQIYYVGDSMGTLTAFAEFSQNQQLATHIKEYFALGPVASVTHIKGLFRFLADNYHLIDWLLNVFGVDQFLPPDWFTHTVAEVVCEDHLTAHLCDNLIFLISGPESQQLNETRVPVYINHTPAGTSTRTMIHFAQNVKFETFQMYDFGSASLNREAYGQDTPPQYHVENMVVPVHLYWGFNDTLANPTDVNGYLVPKIKNLVASTGLDGFSHIDFQWGLKAGKEVYQPVIDEINKSK